MTLLVESTSIVITVIKYTLISLLCYISFLFYRFVSDPLRDIPGPTLGKISGFYSQRDISKGEFHTFLQRMHETYGPIVHFAPNKVSVVTKEGTDKLYSGYTFAKAPFYRAFDYGGPNLFSVGERDVHSQRKKILKKTFSPTNMKEFEPTLQSVGIDMFVKKLNQHATSKKSCDIYSLFHFLLFDIVGQLSFSRDFNLITSGDHPVVNWLKEAQFYGIMSYQFPLIRLIGDRYGRKSYQALMDFCQELIQERKSERLTDAPKKNDVLESFLDDKEVEISDEDIGAEMVTQVIAGTDTTANTLTWCLKSLLENPNVMKKLVNELNQVFPSLDDKIDVETVKKECPYLENILYETMRMYPVGAGFLPRVVPEKGATIEGHFLPPGTECGVASFAYHRSSAIWEDSETFKPERFENNSDAKSKFLPFLIGPRSCIGREMAWMSMYLSMANLIRKFDVSYSNSKQTVTHCYYLVLKPREAAMNITLTPRTS